MCFIMHVFGVNFGIAFCVLGGEGTVRGADNHQSKPDDLVRGLFLFSFTFYTWDVAHLFN